MNHQYPICTVAPVSCCTCGKATKRGVRIKVPKSRFVLTECVDCYRNHVRYVFLWTHESDGSLLVTPVYSHHDVKRTPIGPCIDWSIVCAKDYRTAVRLRKLIAG